MSNNPWVSIVAPCNGRAIQEKNGHVFEVPLREGDLFQVLFARGDEVAVRFQPGICLYIKHGDYNVITTDPVTTLVSLAIPRIAERLRRPQSKHGLPEEEIAYSPHPPKRTSYSYLGAGAMSPNYLHWATNPVIKQGAESCLGEADGLHCGHWQMLQKCCWCGRRHDERV